MINFQNFGNYLIYCPLQFFVLVGFFEEAQVNKCILTHHV